MPRRGDFYANRVTGELAVVLRGDEDSAPGESAIAHLTVKPHGAVAGEHVHPPAAVQRPLFAVLGALGRARGLKAIYAEYLQPYGRTKPGREAMACAGLAPASRETA